MLTAIGVVVAFAELVLRVVVAFAKLVLRVISWLARKASPPTSVEPDSQDVIAQLERLAKLRRRPQLRLHCTAPLTAAQPRRTIAAATAASASRQWGRPVAD